MLAPVSLHLHHCSMQRLESVFLSVLEALKTFIIGDSVRTHSLEVELIFCRSFILWSGIDCKIQVKHKTLNFGLVIY